jgi:hypothetical protein
MNARDASNSIGMWIPQQSCQWERRHDKPMSHPHTIYRHFHPEGQEKSWRSRQGSWKQCSENLNRERLVGEKSACIFPQQDSAANSGCIQLKGNQVDTLHMIDSRVKTRKNLHPSSNEET